MDMIDTPMTIDDNGQHFATRTRVAKKNLTFFREAGRGKALVQINNFVKFSPGLILLTGEEGSGRSRVLKQFADGLKDKQGEICILDHVIKNEEQLYNAIADGFGMELMPGENLQEIQKSVISFLQKNSESNKNIIIALDDTHQCSLAALEALLALRTKFKSMSLVLVGDSGLQAMLQRLQGGKVTASSVVLEPLDAREVRQYISWRIPFQLSDFELANIANVSRGNIGLLEREILKREVSYRQKSAHHSSDSLISKTKITRSAMISVLILALITGGVFAVYFFYRDLLGILPFVSSAEKSSAVIVKPIKAPEVVRTNQEWVERQEILLTDKTFQ